MIEQQAAAAHNFNETLKVAMHDPIYQGIAAGAALLFVLACCRVCAKTGFHALLGLFLLLPGINLGIFLFLAFSRWPIERELRQLRGVQNQARRVDQQRLRQAA